MCLFPRVSQGPQARGVLQGREVDRGPLVVEVTMAKTHSPWLAQLDPEERGEAPAQRAPQGSQELQGHQEMMWDWVSLHCSFNF